MRIDSRQVRTLPKITSVTCEREIFCVIGSAMLLCDDVLDMMFQFTVVLMQPAVFAALVCTMTHKVACRRVHLSLNERIEMLASFEFEDGYEVRRVD